MDDLEVAVSVVVVADEAEAVSAVFVVALLLFGPRQLPQIGRTIGRALGGK